MTGASVRLDGMEATLAKVREAASRARNPRAMWDEIGGQVLLGVQQRFERGQAPDGNPWPASLRVKNYGGRTLVDTGRLLQSMTSQATESSVEVGSNVISAAIHQFGGTIVAKTAKGLFWRYSDGGNQKRWARKQSVTMPARPFLGLDQADEAAIVEIAEDYLSPEGGHAH